MHLPLLNWKEPHEYDKKDAASVRATNAYPSTYRDPIEPSGNPFSRFEGSKNTINFTPPLRSRSPVMCSGFRCFRKLPVAANGVFHWSVKSADLLAEIFSVLADDSRDVKTDPRTSGPTESPDSDATLPRMALHLGYLRIRMTQPTKTSINCARQRTFTSFLKVARPDQ